MRLFVFLSWWPEPSWSGHVKLELWWPRRPRIWRSLMSVWRLGTTSNLHLSPKNNYPALFTVQNDSLSTQILFITFSILPQLLLFYYLASNLLFAPPPLSLTALFLSSFFAISHSNLQYPKSHFTLLLVHPLFISHSLHHFPPHSIQIVAWSGLLMSPSASHSL